MKLREILKGIEVTHLAGDSEVEITAVTSDSRRAEKGSLFFAIPGLKRDGTEFAEQAVRNGAAAVVTERSFASPGAVIVQTGDARKAVALGASNFYGNPSSKLSLIGVTGTSGKTTTTKMIESILDATGQPAGLIGTIEYRAGNTREIADRTTPDAIVLHQWFRSMVDAGVRHAVMEVSSHALALKRTHGIAFAGGVFTNLSRDHFDFHRDFVDYFAAKKILFDQIDRSRRSAVINIDDAHGQKLAAELESAALTFGARGDIRPAADFVCSIDGLVGDVETPAGRVSVRSSLIGEPNLSNWMAAIGAAIVAGIDIPTMEKGIAALASVRGRFERVAVEGGGPTVLVDYAHKPDALEKLLLSVRSLAPKRKLVVVFGCGGDRDQGKRPLMGEIAGRLADYSIVTSDNPRSEPPETIIEQIEEGFRKSGGSFKRITDRREAIYRAVDESDPDAVIVIAGKGHENYQMVKDQILHFDDREEVELALKKRSEKVHSK